MIKEYVLGCHLSVNTQPFFRIHPTKVAAKNTFSQRVCF